MKNNIFLKCECSSESIEVEYDAEMKFYNISMWRLGNYDNKMGFKERIRWCWNIFTTGMPWTDSVILSEDSVKELVEFVENKKQ